jgi:hypothetical protein
LNVAETAYMRARIGVYRTMRGGARANGEVAAQSLR